ncbi:MAG: hypothetical protein NC409_05415 [Clostridium sp.]|nr:hypothetical protein [Clostridium sp.]
MTKSGKIVKYRRPANLNIGMIIFGFIFLYIIICVVTYFRTDHIAGYEVTNGSLSTSNIYTGIAVREEKVVYSAGDGYVNFFAGEGEKIGANQLVYTIDGSGRLAELMSTEREENTLSDAELLQLRQECISFSGSFHDQSFYSVYDFKHTMNGAVLRLATANTLENISSINDAGIAGSVHLYYAAEPGAVIYSVDGYENLTPNDISKELFDQTQYEKKSLSNNELLAQGDVAYKLCTSENWSIVIPLDEEQERALDGESYVKVKFLKDQTQSWANLEILHLPDGVYGVLGFHTSMLTYCMERFIEIELIVEEEKGLKIPVSSIVEKEFFLIPSDYVYASDGGRTRYVSRQVYNDQNGLSWESVNVTVYSESDGNMYVGEELLSGGDVLQKADSEETFTVGTRATLIGVYNINKGYADFRQISILYQNEDYAIVKSNTTYGLCVYDHIVLDASTVFEDDFTH